MMFRCREYLVWTRVVCVMALVWIAAPGPAASESTAGALLARARVAAAADRHRAALDLYLQAIAQDPSLRERVAIELGHQYTWAEQPDSAMVWYNRYLDTHAGDLDAELGVARALAWSDRLAEARTHYKRLLAGAGDRRNDVLLGLARVALWMDRFDEAGRMYEDILERDPKNIDAPLGLAQTATWSGHYRTPGLTGSSRYAFRGNSSDGDFQQIRTSLQFTPHRQMELSGAYTRGRLTRSGLPEIDRDELGLSLQGRFSSALAVTIVPGYQWNRFDAAISNSSGADDFNLFVWDAYATINPRDWVRVDVSNSRQSLGIPLPIFKEIDVTTAGVGLDWRVHYRLATFWALKYADYSDGNQRIAFEQRMEWTSPMLVHNRSRSHFVLSEGIDYAGFDKQPDNGYFSPRSHVMPYGGVRVVLDVNKRLRLDFAGRLGAEKEASQDWNLVGALESKIGFGLAKDLYLTAGYSASASRLDSPAGFRSRRLFVSLDYPLSR